MSRFKLAPARHKGRGVTVIRVANPNDGDYDTNVTHFLVRDNATGKKSIVPGSKLDRPQQESES